MPTDRLDCISYREVLNTVTPYLFPFILEYSLLAVGIMAVMNSEINSKTSPNLLLNIRQVSLMYYFISDR